MPLLLAVLLLLCPSAVFAGVPEEVEMNVAFRINRCDIDSSLRDNSRSLADIRRFIAEAAGDSNIVISAITISGYASPEGPVSLNRRLANGRMHAMEKYVMGRSTGLSSVRLDRNKSVVDLTALRREIRLSAIDGRQTALDILADSVATTAPAVRIKRLKTASHGRLWNEIKPLLANLRYATVTFTFERRSVEVQAPAEPVAGCPADTTAPAVPRITETPAESVAPMTALLPAGRVRRPLYVSLKTNMLYDALLIPSIGAEVYLGHDLSINGNWSYAWWKCDHRHNYWRYYGGDVAVRKWFGRRAAEKPLTGFHAGLYAQLFTYDFELGHRGQMGNKYNYGGGLEGGFALPVARRINIDFTLGAGYIGGRYHEYVPIDNHYVWQATKRRNWFGPTKAEVSLVWLIGHGNVNDKKGGRR